MHAGLFRRLTARGGLPSMEQDTARIIGLQCITRAAIQEKAAQT